MGSKWDACATDNRHLSLEEANEEAVIGWSAPPSWHPDAVPFINHSLDHHFGKTATGQQKPWNFTHNNTTANNLNLPLGQVIDRMQKTIKPRLPSSVYR